MANPVLTRAIDTVASGRHLGSDEAAAVLREIMEGNASESETAGFLVGLRTKGETVAEIVGLARTMRELARRVEPARDGLLDTAGTGGGALTFNVSTTAALVAAGAGCPVAKHGNRSSTSQCGSADVIEALGARIDLEPGAVAACIDELGFGFMFAPLHHPAMKHVVPVRKALAVRTIFNFLGPLTNPAGAAHQVIGVSDPAYVEVVAAALGELGGASALVVSSEDGLDEISVSAPTRVVEVRDGRMESFSVSPEALGVEPAPLDELGAGTPDQNAAITRAVLDGEPGGPRAVTLMNAGAAIYAAGRADTMAEGAAAAAAAIDSGAARELLERFVARTRELAA
ncbi:MAG: anthranilate phosphoribosyltransferase [Thermoleophilaceae bacterium]